MSYLEINASDLLKEPGGSEARVNPISPLASAFAKDTREMPDTYWAISRETHRPIPVLVWSSRREMRCGEAYAVHQSSEPIGPPVTNRVPIICRDSPFPTGQKFQLLEVTEFAGAQGKKRIVMIRVA